MIYRFLNSVRLYACWLGLLLLSVATAGGSVARQAMPVVTVSAASFEPNTPLAPGAIAAAFGAKLATRTVAAEGDADPNTPGIQLPSVLGGTTVEVNGIRAGLFFVSAGQVNYLIPESAATGMANVIVRTDDNTVSTGTVRIAAAAPAIFTARGNGQGPPAGFALRVKANKERVTEPLFQFSTALNSAIPKPIDFGEAGDEVFLILFATGVRQRPRLDAVTVLIGGRPLSVEYAGPQGVFAGLDQINVKLPGDLANLAEKGQINLVVSVNGFAPSQTTQVEVAPPMSNQPLRITSLNQTTLFAGQTLLINGSGFSNARAENQVFITGGDDQTTAQVITPSATQLTVLIPFGSSSGTIRVSTPRGQVEATTPITIRPSVSGFVQDNDRRPIKDMLVRAITSTAVISARTNGDGFFFLPDVRGLSADIEMNGRSETPPLPYPTEKFRTDLKPNGDRQLGYKEFKPITISTVASTPEGVIINPPVSVPVVDAGRQTDLAPSQSSVVFETPPGAVVNFPPGESGPLRLTVLDRGRTPSKLPPGHFSSTIAQITPFGATITPGGRLTFPNADGFPAGATVRLFRFDQTPNSPTLGAFVEAGPARVSADGQRVETEPNAVKEASYYFVSLLRQTTTVVGQVVESDQTPVRRALVVVRGQETLTDGDGIFVVRNVPVNGTVDEAVADEIGAASLEGSQSDALSVEGNFLRPTTRVDRARREGFTPIVGGATRTTDLVLSAPPPNRPPVIQAQTDFVMNAGSVETLPFSVTDPDLGQTVRVDVTGAGFLSLSNLGGGSYLIRLAPAANQAGNYTLVISAIDSLGTVATSQVALTVR